MGTPEHRSALTQTANVLQPVIPARQLSLSSPSPMKTISKASFLSLMKPQGLRLDTQYQPPQTLVFPATSNLAHSWNMPGSPKRVAGFITSLFDATEETAGFYLYPRAGAWAAGHSLQTFQTRAVFCACGVNPNADDVLYATTDEMDAVETLFVISLIFGGTVDDDIFAIPSHGKMLLYADHHEAVHGEFSCADLMSRYLPKIDTAEHLNH